MNYILYADRNFELSLHPSATLYSLTEWFNTSTTPQNVFYGYYDTSPWNNEMESAVFQQPISDKEARIWLFNEGVQRSIATTRAWNYQQGCRLQWHPTQDDEVILNDIRDGTPITRVVNTDGTESRTYNRPIQAVSPTGNEFISLSYARLDRNRPDYGYGLNQDLSQASEDGLWRVNLHDGSNELIVTLSDIIHNEINGQNHYLNHVLYNPTGEQFAFLHRWREKSGRQSRLYCSTDFNEPLINWRTISHYCWLNKEQLLVWGNNTRWGNGYYIVDSTTGSVLPIDGLDGYSDGHPSMSPNGRWIVTDTYPDRKRQRHLLLYDCQDNKEITVGRFLSPFEYRGQKRCDLHPRWSPDGTAISIDSTHEGRRLSYVIDVKDIVRD